ncbi:MAG: hypothetical protein IJI68_02565 [Eggerthellaceae bacterium]|nr:hypothetical protein [Eggerthellaceae bacterium]
MGHIAAHRRIQAITLAFAIVVAVFAAFAFAVAAPWQASAAQGSSQHAAALMAAQSDEADQLTIPEIPVLTGVSVKTQAFVQNKGWQKKWVGAGKTAGTKTKKGLRAVKIKLDGLNKGLTGSICYKAYDKGKGWSSTKANGKAAGKTSTPIQAIRIWLTGDVSAHYDVLYRVYIKGSGWQPWVKNKAKAGIIKKGFYASALQVKLSPKTADAAGTADTVGVRYEARLVGSGWQPWAGSGGTAGKAADGKIIDGFVMRLNGAGIGGGVQYRAYVQGKQWSQGWKTNGKTAGQEGKRTEALQIKLTGAIAEKYDIYYRTYVTGYSWLGWAKNGGTAGSTGQNLPISAVQVVMVSKGTIGPKAGEGTTVNAVRKTLNGIDISSWQYDLNIAKVPADFVIVKATGGKGYTNPYFNGQAYATLKSGKLLGVYHFAREAGCSGTAVQEADYFVKAVGNYVGRAVLVLDWEANALVLGPSWAKKFLDRVYEKTGVRPLIYMSKSPTREFDWSSVAKHYKLWVAQYPNYSRTGYQSKPWTDSYSYGAWSSPTIFQYSSSGLLKGYSGNLDLDIFYGNEAYWKKLASKS